MMPAQAVLAHAAALLEHEAQALKQCSTFQGDWGDEHEARAAHDDMLATAAALRALQAVEWIPVERMLPDSDMTVHVFNPRGTEPVWLGYHNGVEWITAEGDRYPGVTHWAEMIEGPRA